MSAAVGPVATPIQRVRGTNDVLPPHDARLRQLEARLRSGFERFGYEGIQTPVLEPLDLFLRKSGDEILGRMFAFSHWNRRLCLRPELTASVMRAVVSELGGRGLPLRLHYGGPTFRYERPSRARYRQFTQVGLELIGAGGPAADAEVLHLACAGLEDLGVTTYRLVVGHLGVVLELLRQQGMGEHAQGLLLDTMEPLARGQVSADDAVRRIVDLLGGAGDPPAPDGDGESWPTGLSSLPPEQAAAIAADVLRHASLPLEGGSREPTRIIQRLLARASRPDPTAQVRAAVEFMVALHQAAGSVNDLPALRRLVAGRGLSTAPLDELEGALEALAAYGGPRGEISVDLSLARGLRYYTGFVFEVYVDREDGPLQVAGGGRYDDLLRALGGREPTPACGFSYGLERLGLVHGAEDEPPPAPRVLVVGVSPSDHAAAVGLAAALRSADPAWIVEQDVRLRGPRAALRHADRVAANLVVMVGEREREERVALLRDMRSREERRVPLDDLVPAARALLA